LRQQGKRHIVSDERQSCEISAALAEAGHLMTGTYRKDGTARPFNPATIKAMVEGRNVQHSS
jgi:hypothetical protein